MLCDKELADVRNKLLASVKQNKSDEYRSGYVDGVLDLYNESVKEKLDVMVSPI